MRITLLVIGALLALPLMSAAQKPATTMEAVETSATIEAIDHSSRMITLKDKTGDTRTIYCPPEVKRFDELKVGDTVTFRYQESMAYAIRKPGQPSGQPKASDPVMTRSQGKKPGATIAQQDTATVTVKTVDLKTPSITVTTEDGRTVSFKVDDKKKLEGVNAGDKVEVTYTQALIVSVK
jgi:Cu/Ag efflux protein CusF